MKITTTRLAFVAAILTSSAVFAQQKMDDMKDMDMAKKPAASAEATHMATGTVKTMDAKAGTVTLAHGPVASLNWPAMTMKFKVKDKALMKKLNAGNKVDIEFVKDRNVYVVTKVK